MTALNFYSGLFTGSEACFVDDSNVAMESNLVVDAKDLTEDSRSWLFSSEANYYRLSETPHSIFPAKNFLVSQNFRVVFLPRVRKAFDCLAFISRDMHCFTKIFKSLWNFVGGEFFKLPFSACCFSCSACWRARCSSLRGFLGTLKM